MNTMPYRNMDCPRYDDCLTYAAVKNRMNLHCDTCINLSNHQDRSKITPQEIESLSEYPEFLVRDMVYAILECKRKGFYRFKDMPDFPQAILIENNEHIYRRDEIIRFRDAHIPKKPEPWEIKTIEAARLLGITRETLLYWRIRCIGPKPFRRGRLFYYDARQVEAYKAKRSFYNQKQLSRRRSVANAHQ